MLLRSKFGVSFQKLEIDNQRMENIFNWINQFESYSDMQLKMQKIINSMSFDKRHDVFEKLLNEFGLAIRFACERPEKKLKKGPGNLWNIKED